MDRSSTVWCTVAVVSLVLLAGVSVYAFVDFGGKDDDTSAEKMLTYWTDTDTKKQLISYVENVTDSKSKDFIPVSNRIAVFDFDGTLFCETDPNYFDYMLLVHRVLEDPDYKDIASAAEKETAQDIVKQNNGETVGSDLPVRHGKAIASAFKGMTMDELDAYIQNFKKTAMNSYEGMTRGNGWYLPMKQVLNYLEAHDFTVYIVSGTDRFLVRAIVNGSDVDIPANRIIGSDENLVATNQGGTDGLDYTFASNDKVITGGEFQIKNLKMNKTTAIVREIGIQPVLSFGNSTGDSSMAMYTITDNKYSSKAFMLCCDDTERENGNTTKADKMYALCSENGWTPISMKNDWKTIYGDGVKYTGAA